MAGNSEHIPNFKTFQRYHSGEMSLREQHLFEKQMLQDPVLADAYEGFLALQQDGVYHEAVKRTLEQRLESRIADQEKRAFPVWTFGIAAALILSIGVLWLAFLSNPEKQETLVTPPTQLPEQSLMAQQPEEIKATPEVASAPQIALKPSKSKPGIPSETESAAVVDNETLLAEETESFVAVENINDVSQTVPAEPDAASYAYSTKPGARAAQPVGIRTDSLVRKNEVIVSQAAVGKPAMAVSRAEQNPSKSLSPKPLMGWASYQMYLQQKADSVMGSGEVTVNFKVNADGTLSDFSAVGDDGLFKEAIRIVRNGPAWVPAKQNATAITQHTSVKLRFTK